MRASVLYRISSVLIFLFAAGHTFGFRQINPSWRIQPLIASMQSTHFVAQGFSRTYWDFYVGFGLFVSLLLVLTALLAWQLGGLSTRALVHMQGPAWVLALCFVGVTVLSIGYFFWIPIVFSAIIALLLVAAACFLPRTSPGSF